MGEEEVGYLFIICDTFCNLMPFLQFEKRKKHLWRSVTCSKVADFSLQRY